jgi:hypothetical protein
MTRAEAPASITVAAVKTAVALITRQAVAPDVQREDVLGGVPADGVLEAMEAVAGGLLAGISPGDGGAAMLERVGLAIADLEGAES